MGLPRAISVRVTLVAATAAAMLALAPHRTAADDRPFDADFAKPMFAGSTPAPKAYACFVRRYAAAHLAQHPLQKVSVTKLLISTEKDPNFPNFQYSFRLGVNFRDRPGDFDSSGNCGHAPTIKDPWCGSPNCRRRVTLICGREVGRSGSGSTRNEPHWQTNCSPERPKQNFLPTLMS